MLLHESQNELKFNNKLMETPHMLWAHSLTLWLTNAYQHTTLLISDSLTVCVLVKLPNVSMSVNPAVVFTLHW